MSWTLAELSKIETDTLRKSVLDTLIMESNLLEVVPQETIGTLTTTLVRYQDLPSVGYRKVNAGFTESTGKFEQRTESVSLGGLDIDTDKVIARSKNTIADARAIQQTMALKSFAYQYNWKFIAGNPTVDPDEFKGLRLRVDDVYDEGFVDQKIQSNDTDTGINNSSTTRFNFLDDLNKLMYAISGHSPDVLLMNAKTLLAVRSLLLREKLLDTTRDMFDRQVDVYMGARMMDIGVRQDQITEIILNTETAAGAPDGGSENTSIYAAKFGIGDMFWGIEMYPLEVTDLGELQTAPVFRTRMDWPHGLADINPRAIGRLYGIVPDSSS